MLSKIGERKDDTWVGATLLGIHNRHKLNGKPFRLPSPARSSDSVSGAMAACHCRF